MLSKEQRARKKSLKRKLLLEVAVNLVFLCTSLSMLVFGVLYMTVYQYEYSFSFLNPTLLADILIAFGVAITGFAVTNAICVFLRKKRFSLLVKILSVFVLIFYLCLFSISIWGLTVILYKDSLGIQVSRMYSIDIAQARIVNYVQSRFHCCGIKSAKDWEIPINGTTYCMPPDSCCIVQSFNCAKACNPQVLNSSGCFDAFMNQLIVDLWVLISFIMGVSSLAITIWAIHVGYLAIQKWRHRKLKNSSKTQLLN